MAVLFFAGFIWLMGAVFRQSVERRLIALTFLYLFVLLSTLQFDVGAGPRAVIKGSTGEWLVFGMVAAFIALYAMGIKYLRAKTAKKAADEPTVAPAGDGPFAEGEITRYARHIMLREIGGLGQKRLKEASVLVIGAGGLGAPALLYLSAAGVGRIGIVDDDVVDLS
ncbi:MAG: HesA/MoeB/ThiF family protein, partial [Halocynthiibacter sp.]